MSSTLTRERQREIETERRRHRQEERRDVARGKNTEPPGAGRSKELVLP